jgi:general secretion pathway protein C
VKRLPSITSFVLFISLCVSAAYWAMQLFNPPVRAISVPPQATQSAPKLDAAAGLLGGHSAAVASNFQLKGVVVGNRAADSIAVVMANGKKAHAYKTNEEVMPGVTIQEVQNQYVLLSDNGVTTRIELPVNAKRQ